MQDRARCRFIPRARRRVSPGSRALRRACSRPYNPHPTEAILEAFLVSLGIVALAEIGDKTQLLALVLAARYRRPVPVILGIFAATLANHALAAWLGAEVAGVLGPDMLRWILGLSFLAMARNDRPRIQRSISGPSTPATSAPSQAARAWLARVAAKMPRITGTG